MPKVSTAHLEATRRRILDAARRCFTRNGFHSTSMQDVLAEAGLSAGAVYRYFGSKDEIIAAIVDAALDEVTGTLQGLLEAPAPPPLDEVLWRVLHGKPPLDPSRASARLIVQVWSEVVRDEALGRRYLAALERWQALFEQVVTDYQQAGLVTPAVPAPDLATALIALLQGFIVRVALAGDGDVRTLRAGVSGLLAGLPAR
jgi:AcrR family transcriptional regulator